MALGQQWEQGAADESHIGQEIGVAGAGAIFAHEGVAAPMIADFHSGPMSANPPQPLPGRVILGRGAGQIVTGLGAGCPGFFGEALAAQNDQGSGKGEVGGEWLEVEGMELPDFDSSVAGLGVGKKGVSFKPSSPCAWRNRLGWLPLTWKR